MKFSFMNFCGKKGVMWFNVHESILNNASNKWIFAPKWPHSPENYDICPKL